MRELTLGMAGEDVARWQRFLLRAGALEAISPGAIFDASTSEATYAWQERTGLPQSGAVDTTTLVQALQEGLLDPALDPVATLAAPTKEATATAARRLDWSTLVPLMVAVVGGLVTAGVAVWSSVSGANNALKVEREKLRSSIILAAIRTDEPAKSLANLRFFAQLRFIDLDEAQLRRLEEQPASVPVLPSGGASPATRLSREELEDLVGGVPAFQEVSPGSGFVELDAAWVERNIVQVEVPQLRGMPNPSGEPFGGRLRFHRAAAPALLAAFAEIEQAGLMGDVKSFNGAFAQRLVRGQLNQLSPHALGIAIDLNTQWNPFGSTPRPAGQEGSTARLVPIMAKHGFVWGGTSARPDPMHFEFTNRAGLLAP